MLIKRINLEKLKNYVDWKLLVFLVLFLNVKLAVKIPAIILIYLLQADFRFKFSLKNSRLPLFYPLIILVALAGFIINRGYADHNYWAVMLNGIGFWLLCILAIHQVKLAVERNEAAVINRTIAIFFIINAAVTLFNIGCIVWETGALNPYTYQGDYQKYFINTGDYIRGLTFDTSTTNAILSAFGVIYFLAKKNAVMLIICMIVLLLTASNFTNLVLLAILAVLFIFRSTRDQKSLIAISLMLLVIFMVKVSPQNSDYVVETFNNTFHRQNHTTVQQPTPTLLVSQMPDSLLNAEEKKEKIALLYLDSVYIVNHKKPAIVAVTQNKPVLKTDAGRIYTPKPDINSAPYQSLVTTPKDQSQLVTFINAHIAVLPISGHPSHWLEVPGKITGAFQTISFFKNHPAKIFAGDGMGNFSSKLAFKASGLAIAGGYPAKYTYINHDFLVNHLDLYLNFFSRSAGLHSLTNSPFSVYDQLFAEYGIIGLLIFCIYYLGFFAKNIKALTYGLPVLVLMMAAFFVDYWFEQLSVLVFFELLLLLDIKESSANVSLNYGHQ